MKRLDLLRNYLESINCDSALLTSYPAVFYFSGFTSEDAYLFVTKNEQYIVTDSRYFLQAKSESNDFQLISGSCADFKYLKPLIKKENISSIAFEDLHFTVSAFKSLKESIEIEDLIPLNNKITDIRRCKSGDEVEKITKALKLAEYALNKTVLQISAGMTEVQVAAILESNMRSEGAEKTSFDTICASGFRSAFPHGTASNKVIEKGDFLTLDFGCILDGYCSDITRTFVIGTASEKQKEIYNTVLNAQLSAEKIISAGISCKDADASARRIINEAGYGINFGHSLGHGVGIEIHELPNLSPRSESILSAGDIVTVEPGIYIEDFGGVRIEDMVHISENETKILTTFPKELIIL